MMGERNVTPIVGKTVSSAVLNYLLPLRLFSRAPRHLGQSENTANQSENTADDLRISRTHILLYKEEYKEEYLRRVRKKRARELIRQFTVLDGTAFYHPSRP